MKAISCKATKKILRNMERVSYIFCIFVSASMSYIINYTLLYSIISRAKQNQNPRSRTEL